MKGKCNKPIVPANEEWVPFAQMKTIRQRDKLIEGYCIPLDGKEFRLFVMEELTGTKRGYILKLMLGWGDNTSIDLQKQKLQYPQTTNLMKRHLPDAWKNKGKTRRCYKYIIFGHGESNKHLALSLLHSIVADIINQNGGNNK